MRTQPFIFACVVTLLGAAQSFGGVLAPGGSGSGTDFDANLFPLPDDADWRGELLDQRSEDYEFVGEVSDGGEPAPFARGTFTSSVYRDLQTGGLAFLYSLARSDTGGINDLERVVIGSFATVDTDVYASMDDHFVERTADGATLNFGFNVEGVDGNFLVRTNATAFDADGSFVVAMDFEPSGVERTDTFAAFQPAAAGPGPTPVPLPPAAWAALATLAAGGGIRRARAHWRTARA